MKPVVTLVETDARRLFRRCVWVSFIPIMGFALVLWLATFETSLPEEVIRPTAVFALIMVIGGDFCFCRDLGRLARGLGQSGSRWSRGVWVASKIFVFFAWWLALLKIRRILNRAYAPEPIPFFPR